MSSAKRVARRWAYIGILVGGLASVAGNVASTVLTDSGVALALRVPWAVLWPVLTYIGIEVLTRTQWRKGFAHYGARAVLVGPVSLVAAFVSYLHLHHLMVMSGEPGLAQLAGPLAVDGTLFGCTVVLLITGRLQEEREPEPIRAYQGAPLTAAETEEFRVSLADVLPQPKQLSAWETAPVRQTPAPTHSVQPYGPHPLIERKPRASRSAKWDRELAVELIKNSGLNDSEIGEKVGTSYKTIQRLRRQLREQQEQNVAVPA